jgi:phospholipid/cholesterol/gamma-HCH transport system substrate-binding protein
MKKSYFVAAGAFVVIALALFTIGLFLIGNRHKAFAHHIDFYTDLTDVNGIEPGSKVRVSGYEAGQVTAMQIPDRPSGQFRLKLHIDDKLHNLVRSDSFVSVESDGLVGDKFLQIHEGSDQAQEASNGATLPSKEPVEISAIIAKATGVMDQANATIGDVRGKLDGALTAVTSTVNNANGIITGVRQGKGTIGMLLKDEQTSAQVKQTVANAQQASANLNQVSVQAKQIVTDFQSRDLFQKAEDTLNNAKHASQQLDQTSVQINNTLNEALGPDRAGQDAAENIRESLGNVNLATANLGDDTEALKHNFFFRGFFKKRGYYSLSELTPDEYRSDRYFQSPANHRVWLNAADAFITDANGKENLSAVGESQINQFVGNEKDSIVERPLVVEGYCNEPSGADQVTKSRSRAILVARYLEQHFHLNPKNIGLMPLNATPPASSGETSWNGAAIVLLPKQPS